MTDIPYLTEENRLAYQMIACRIAEQADKFIEAETVINELLILIGKLQEENKDLKERIEIFKSLKDD